jgi:Mg2+/Co2+ transporter CorB
LVKYDKDLLDGVLDLSDTEIGEIMVHRKDIDSIDADLSINEILKAALEINHTRIPLWRENK